MTLGERLKYNRTKADLTQREVNKTTGINYKTLSNWENDVSKPSPDDLIILANTYNVTTDYLLGLSDQPQGTGFQKGLLGDINGDAPLAKKARMTKPNLDSEDLLAQLHQEGIMLDGCPLTAADAERLRDTIAFAIDQAKKTQGQQ